MSDHQHFQSFQSMSSNNPWFGSANVPPQEFRGTDTLFSSIIGRNLVFGRRSNQPSDSANLSQDISSSDSKESSKMVIQIKGTSSVAIIDMQHVTKNQNYFMNFDRKPKGDARKEESSDDLDSDKSEENASSEVDTDASQCSTAGQLALPHDESACGMVIKKRKYNDKSDSAEPKDNSGIAVLACKFKKFKVGLEQDSCINEDIDYIQCRICHERPINSVFTHRKHAHAYSCYTCALKVWKINKRCPACIQKTYRVLKILMA